MTSGIYRIIDSRNNNTLYVGASNNIELRFKRHLSMLRSSRHPRKEFVAWFQKEPRTLALEILEELDDRTLFDAREIAWFNKLEPIFHSHIPHSDDKWMHSEGAKLKISETLTNTKSETSKPAFLGVCAGCQKTFESKRNKVYCSKGCVSMHNPVSGYISDEKLYEMATSQGMSTREIAKQVGFSHVTVSKKIKKHLSTIQTS